MGVCQTLKSVKSPLVYSGITWEVINRIRIRFMKTKNPPFKRGDLNFGQLKR